MRNVRTWRQIAGIGMLAAMLGYQPQAAQADIEYFPYTYGWMTPPKGEAELEIRHTSPVKAHHWQDEFALEYGVTDRYVIEPYIVVNRSGGFGDPPSGGGVDADGDEGGGGDGSAIWDPIHNGAAYRYGGFKIEQRYRFGDFAYNKILATAYLEYAQMRDESPEIESKLILEYNTPSRVKLALNLVNESHLRHEKPTWGYSFGAAYIADPGGKYWLGGEAFGNWSSTQHWAGPTAGFAVDQNTRLTGTYGKQTSGNTGDVFRVTLSHEFN